MDDADHDDHLVEEPEVDSVRKASDQSVAQAPVVCSVDFGVFVDPLDRLVESNAELTTEAGGAFFVPVEGVERVSP